MTEHAALSIAELSVRLGHRQVLDRVSLELHAGERLALLGPSGSGKSTLLRCVAGLHEQRISGEISLHGRRVTQAGRQRVPPAERGVAMVFQDLALWPHLSVARTLRFACGRRYRSRDERRAAITEMIRRLGLQGRETARPAHLSGGEQQRLAIGRALMANAPLLLLDEPFGALDLPLRLEIIALLRELQESLGFAVLHVTHDPLEALRVARRVACLEAGRIVWSGDVDSLPGQTDGPAAPLARALRQWMRTAALPPDPPQGPAHE